MISELVERSGCVRESTFIPRASAPWLIRGRELCFETWERINTDIYKHGICPKIYTAGFFRLKILHHQFHLILTVLVGKTQKMRENEEIYTAGKSFTLDRMVIFAKNLSKFIFFWETTFRVSSSGEWLSQEMAKSTFGLTLSAQLIDLPLHRQFVRQVKVYLCTMSYRQRMEKLKFCKI